MGASRSYDIVLYGATGFVGRQTVRYLAARGAGLRWALAGRNGAKLEQARAQAGEGAKDAGIVVADAQDAAALRKLAAQARVVLSTAGPFALHGTALVDACVDEGTHYVDITGETPWVRSLIDRHHERAAKDGTRIVPCCGFDSVPSDLGAWLVVHQLWQQYREPCVSVRASFALRGGFNGGTLASALNLMEQGQAHALADPFLLNPADARPANAAAHADPVAPHHDADFGGWLAPFFMGPVNTRVVRRSAALLRQQGDAAYDAAFSYQEYLRFGGGPLMGALATGFSIGLGAAQVAMRFGLPRELARRVAIPPGAGPSERAMDQGWFRCELVARSASGNIVRGRIADKGDPGNRATTKLVCEAALTLACDADALPGAAQGGSGGVLTPAVALGAPYARRLLAAGMTVEPTPPDGSARA
jgi:short subunit dehydrogenase-like uncharacterized protein